MKKRILAALLTGCMLFGLAACNDAAKPGTENSSGVTTSGTAQGSEDGSTGTDTNSEGITSNSSDSSQGSTLGQQSSGSSNNTTAGKNPTTTKKPASTTQGSTTKVFKVESYGAKGDGKTDDGVAIANAIKAACKDTSAKKIVQFKSNATYRVTSVPKANATYKAVMEVVYGDNIVIAGSNTTLLMKAPINVIRISESSNITMQGFNIDYSPKPFANATVTAVNSGQGYVDFNCPTDLGFSGTVSAPSTYFAFRNRKDERLHFMISKMTKLGTNSYRFYFTTNCNAAAVGQKFILPVYGSSHDGSLMVADKTENITFSSINIYAAPNFVCGMRENSGNITFNRVSLKPAANSDVYLTSWRDGFHIKDNYGKLVWNNCYIGPLGDDAFNLSSVICNIDSVNGRVINMVPTEAGESREGIKVGDEIVIYNLTTGAAVGTAKIAKVIRTGSPIAITIDRDLPNITNQCQVGFYSFNKNYEINDTYIEGTVRVRSSGSFNRCKFNVFWVRVENEYYIEGPVPKDVYFRNCTFTTPYDAKAQIFVVATQNKYQQVAKYKCKNIVLDGCTFTKGTTLVQAGNELIVK